MPWLQASPHPGMFGKLIESLRHREWTVYRSYIILLPSGGRPKPSMTTVVLLHLIHLGFIFLSDFLVTEASYKTIWRCSFLGLTGTHHLPLFPSRMKILGKGLLEPCGNSQPSLNIRLMGSVNFQHFTYRFSPLCSCVWLALSWFGLCSTFLG